MTRVVSIAQSGANNVTMRNKIINGGMVIDQRNAGASITPSTNGTMCLDRWKCGLNTGLAASKYSVQQSSTAPAGFNNSVLITSTSAYTVQADDYSTFSQAIEGFNFADLGWGTANAQPITISFQIRSSLTGTFAGWVQNNNADRSYPFTFTISAANTWESKTVTIAGDTSGTWVGATNSTGLLFGFNLGTGSNRQGTANAWNASNARSVSGAVNLIATNAATMYITGVQLEAGTTATPFEQRLYGTELALCQRYLPVWTADTTAERGNLLGQAFSSTVALDMVTFAVPARVPPTGLTSTGAFTQYNASLSGLSVSALAFNNANIGGASFTATVSGGLVAGNATLFQSNGSAGAARIIFTGCEL